MRCSLLSAVLAGSCAVVVSGCGGGGAEGEAVDVVVLRQPGPGSEGPDPTDPTAEPPTDVDTGDDGADEPVDEPIDEPVDEPVDEPIDEPVPPAPEEPAPCPRVRVDVADGATLNVRPSPDTRGAPLLSLADGAIVDVVDVAVGADVGGVDTWYGVDVDGVYGFVSAAYAACTEDEAPVAPVVDDGFYLPLTCGSRVRIAQGNFGQFSHSGRSRYAFDFSIPVDTPMVAMERGTIAAIYDQTGPGDRCYSGGGEDCFRFANYVAVRHPDGSVSIYKHLNRVDVSVGDVVERGEVVGLSGSTGYSTGPHAHVMRQQDCGGDQLSCESLPLVFVDVDDGGVPARDDWVTSGNCL